MTNLLYPRNNIATPLKKIGWIRNLAGELISQWEENYIRNVSESRDKRVCQNKSPENMIRLYYGDEFVARADFPLRIIICLFIINIHFEWGGISERAIRLTTFVILKMRLISLEPQ